MIEGLEHLETDFDLAEYLQSLLIDHATGGCGDDLHYKYLREYFLDKSSTKTFIPRWIKVNRDLSQFWQFIKFEYKNMLNEEILYGTK